MAVPRHVLIALIGGVLVLAVFAFTRVAGQSGDEPAAAAPAPAPAALQPAPAGEQPGAQQPGAQQPAEQAEEPGVPARLERALARGQVAVVAFTQKGGAEDSAVRSALDALRGVPVFIDDVRNIGAYREVVGQLAIERAPAVVVVDRNAKAQVVEGYVDAGSLRQLVEDAR